jgi:UDP-N-acetylglucosamine:LPS N-acetylglucosamine transferase
MVYATDHPAGLFPAVDYFNAVDYLICGAGYNAFWEAVYFQKEAYFIPLPRNFEDQRRRVAECQDHLFEENGADQLVELLLQL